MSKVLFIHKKNKTDFKHFSNRIVNAGPKTLCIDKVNADFLKESIQQADYLFINIFRNEIRGFAAVYHDNFQGKHLHISLLCNSKQSSMKTRKHIPKLGGKAIINAILEYGKKIKVKDVRLDAIKEVIPYYYNLGFRFEKSQITKEQEKLLVKQLKNAQSNNNTVLQRKIMEKIVLKFYTGYFNEKFQHDMGKNTQNRIMYAMDFGIPMKYIYNTTSICKGKTIKNPNKCRKYKTCKVVHGKKRSYCRTIKNTRKNQKGGKDKLFPSVEIVFQDSLHKSIEKLFMSQKGNDYKLNSLDNDDYNDLVSLFKNGVEFRGKIIKPSPTYSYQDFNGKFWTNSPRYNIVQLLFTQNIDFSDFLQYLADNHPEFFDKNNSTRMLFMASEYLHPTTEKLIEILETKEILYDVLNPIDIRQHSRVVSPIIRLFNINNNIIRFGFKINRQPRIIELMKLFIDKGANKHDKDAYGKTTLLLASDQGYEQVVSYLLSINLDINSQAESNDYITPLYSAIRNNKKNVSEILIKHRDPNNSISIKELAKQLENARYYNRDSHIYELLVEEIENRKIEGITDVVEKTTEKVGKKIDGKDIAEEIYSFLPDKSAAVSQERRRAYYGGTKVELIPRHRITAEWKGKDRQIYTYPTDLYTPESQDEYDDTFSLEQFTETDSFEQLKEPLKPGITYLFVIEYVNKTKAVMYLGDQGHTHSQLSADKGDNWILAAGEIRRDEGMNKLKISNQSGHYQPDSKHVKDVTIDFFARRINIDFYKPFQDTSESEASQSQSPQSPLDMMYAEPDDGVYIVP